MSAALKVVFVALALALDVFAVCIGVGVRGVAGKAKLRIGAAFALAEITMILIGTGLGVAAGHVLGNAAGYVGFAALFGFGIYMVRESRREVSPVARLDLSRGWGLATASLAISLDSLGIGFSILYIGVPFPVSLVAIGAVSVCSTASGLALGRHLGKYAERNAALLGGLLLALTGLGFALVKALHGG